MDAEEASMLIQNGIRYLGFPLRVPDRSREDLSEADAATIIRSLPYDCHAVLITYIKDANDIVDFCGQLGTQIVQLHGAVSVDQLSKLRQHAPKITIIKSVVVGNQPQELFEVIDQATRFVDAFLIDTFDPQTGWSGATGKTHDWTISKRLINHSRLPVILAGGLNPGNVHEAILQVRPAGVDVHTGVEDPDGRKNPDRVRRFIEEASIAFES
jgi:phosphoribosylanthranilate isomerase